MPDIRNTDIPDLSGSKPDGQRENVAHQRPVSVSDLTSRWGLEFPFKLAAPSFVLPAGAKENALFLTDYFPEIALLFFEADACLDYTENDLPESLANLPVSWHVHMPLDFRWEEGLDAIWQKLDGLIDKAGFLGPQAYVLHPPTEPDMLLPLAARLRDKGVAPADFLLENIRSYSLTPIWEEAREGGFSTCLDIGHVLAYDQFDVLQLPGFWDTVRMVHLYGAEKRMKHQPLTELDEQGLALVNTMFDNFRGDTITLEVFDKDDLFASLNHFCELFAAWRNTK